MKNDSQYLSQETNKIIVHLDEFSDHEFEIKLEIPAITKYTYEHKNTQVKQNNENEID